MLSTLTKTKFGSALRSFSVWSRVPLGPPDPIMGLNEAFKKDNDPRKVNLGVGAYRDDNGKPVILECVQKSMQLMEREYADFDYLPVDGHPEFIEESIKLAYGHEHKLVQSHAIAGCQALSGTGSLRLCAAFLRRFYHSKEIYLPDITWPNHRNVFRDSGLELKSYKYYQPKTKGLDYDTLLFDLRRIPNGSVVLFHASAHNPTGVDPKPEQWDKIRDVLKEKNMISVFDMAYQGYTSGDPERDAYSVRSFVDAGIPVLLAQSFAKNMGLYGLRVGLFSVVCENQSEAQAVQSQLKQLARPLWSNPPIIGARIVSGVLKNQELYTLWLNEIKKMATRSNSMRKAMVDNLKALNSPHIWDHITEQVGMFAYTGLSVDTTRRLRTDFHIYLTHDGRISVPGLNTKNVEYVAKAFHEVTKNEPSL